MKNAAIVRLLRQAACSGTLLFSRHARDEMDAEGETEQSVERVLRKARTVALQDNGRWKVRDAYLSIILHIENETVFVVTVYAG